MTVDQLETVRTIERALNRLPDLHSEEQVLNVVCVNHALRCVPGEPPQDWTAEWMAGKAPDPYDEIGPA